MNPQALDFHKALFEELDTEKLQRKFLDCLLEMQRVERGSIWIRNDDHYCCIEAVGAGTRKLKGFCIPAEAQSIVGWVMENGKMTIAEPWKDKRHYKEAEVGLDVKSTLILCYPLILKDGGIYGAVEIIDTAHSGSRLKLDKDYLELMEELVSIGAIALGNSLAFASKETENKKLKRIIEELKSTPLIGGCESFQAVLKSIRNYAKTHFPVLITGESGTGKELVAREIHRQSERRGGPFLVQNVSAIPDTLLESELFGYKKGAFTGADADKIGLFEAANGGTVFLDEIGDMPMTLQARILRVIQENEIKPLGGTAASQVDVRIISATNRDLTKAIAEGEFREDLFYRLNVLPLRLPPLRERAEDIPLLLDFFFKRDAQTLGIPAKKPSAKTRRILLDHAWKGNIREMENFVRYLLTTVESEVIEPEDLPETFFMESAAPGAGDAGGPAGRIGRPEQASAPGPAPSLAAYSWEELERAYVLELMEKTKWNISKAASQAKVNRSTFDSRLKKLGVRKE